MMRAQLSSGGKGRPTITPSASIFALNSFAGIPVSMKTKLPCAAVHRLPSAFASPASASRPALILARVAVT